jgi:NDP-sugar pyrophosphorylase family protein
VDIDSSVELSSPVFLGAGATLKRDVKIGTRTVIGEDTLVDEGARICRSVIGSRSLVGRGASISDCLVGSEYAAADGEIVTDRTLIAAAHYGPAPVAPRPVKQVEPTPGELAKQEAPVKRPAA